MTALEKHRQAWKGKSDEWIVERLDNELKQKVEEIHRLVAENESLRKTDVSGAVPFYDVDELNEIIKLFNNKEIGLYTCIGRVWNKAYFIGANEGMKAGQLGNMTTN